MENGKIETLMHANIPGFAIQDFTAGRQLDKRAGAELGYCSGNRGSVRTDNRPTGGQQHHDGEATLREVLVVAKILVGRDVEFETGGLGSAQEISVL